MIFTLVLHSSQHEQMIARILSPNVEQKVRQHQQIGTDETQRCIRRRERDRGQSTNLLHTNTTDVTKGSGGSAQNSHHSCPPDRCPSMNIGTLGIMALKCSKRYLQREPMFIRKSCLLTLAIDQLEKFLLRM